ncbi:MAG: hypothetical protein EB060_10970 [Proteobacteria bacterium]|nr:hypothetical protein [Pseudomonadota bacterium]
MEETLMTQAASNPTDGAVSQQGEAAQAPAQAEVKAASEQASTQESKSEAQTETKTEASDGKGEEAKAEQAAELADFVAPEGVQLDSEAATEFKNLAKELGLKQEGAQKVADIGFKLAQKWGEKQAEQVSAAKAAWIEGTKSDKEFGGDKLNENLAVAKKALDTFGTPELRTLLNESGLGNHPEIIRAFFRAGKAISEDRFVTGSAPKQTGDKDLAKSLYPNQTK